MLLIRKVNAVYFFYNYCYCITWQRLWKKPLQQAQVAGSFFPIICFILYLFLLAVILWRCGVHARWSGPPMLWIDMVILAYGIYVGSRKDLLQCYFERFSRKTIQYPWFRIIIYLIIFSPVMAILLSLFIAKSFIGL